MPLQTLTLNGSYGSGVTIAGTGILMNNEMDDFAVNKDVLIPGLIRVKPTPLLWETAPSSMTPTFITKDKKLFLVIGSPGGPTIINTVLQVVLNVIDFGFTIQKRSMPRFHHQYLPDELRLESRDGRRMSWLLFKSAATRLW
jgi:gamma-glutamyltranspeptidase/glutathione hydrolase